MPCDDFHTKHMREQNRLEKERDRERRVTSEGEFAEENLEVVDAGEEREDLVF